MQSSHLDTSCVLDWNARSKRAQPKQSQFYWNEFVETDEWYRQELLKDIPANEMHYACYDENFEDDVDEDALSPDDDDDDDSESGTYSEENDSTDSIDAEEDEDDDEPDDDD